MRQLITAAGFALFASHASALGLGDLSNADASQGLKQALIQGAERAVSQLGAAGGFLNNPQVKIPLPASMQKAEKAMRMFGMGKQADELVVKMNEAAEAAVPEAKTLLVNAVKNMSVSDAKGILTGGEDSATQYFRKVTAGPMAEKFLPIVKKATENVDLAQQYNKFADMGSKYGLVNKDQPILSNMSPPRHWMASTSRLPRKKKPYARTPWGRPATC